MIEIVAIAGALPEREVTNEQLDRENPSWRMDLVAELSGVESRRRAAAEQTPLDLSIEACGALLQRPEVDRERIDAILYCTPTPDHVLPGNAHLLHAHLGVGDEVFALDIPLSCSGFVYGLALADALIGNGTASGVLLVNAEAPSKRMNPGDRSVQALLGDGAAATLLHAGGGSGEGGRLVASRLRSHGRRFADIYIPAGGARTPASAETRRTSRDRSGNVRSPEDLHMDGTALWSFVSSVVPGHIRGFLADQALTPEDVDVWVFHQASRMILDSLVKALAIPRAKAFEHMSDVGNLGSASIPFALRAALAEGAIRPGDRVLLCAFGAGLSYGSAIVEF